MEANGVAMLVVVLLSTLEFYLMPLGMTVLDAVMGIEVVIDVVTGITVQGLINLLVGTMNWSAVSVS